MTDAAASVHVRAPGKLNLFFRVGALGSDGYHDVASAYQAVSLFEDLWARPADDFSVEVAGTVDIGRVPLDESNLALRAARLLADETGTRRGVRLTIRKGVPVAGGMGGGSADAAAALVACDALWGTGLSAERLHALAARLGADVPFALAGGTAVGLGRGDELRPAEVSGRYDWVLVTSAAGLSTPDVYRALDAQRDRGDASPPPAVPEVHADVLAALRAADAEALAAAIRNDLQSAAVELRPELADTLASGERLGALAGMVSGSGPTVAFLTRDEEHAVDLAADLRAEGRQALRVHGGPVEGARIVSVQGRGRDEGTRG
ncbi:4-(cytidine 5'-diphospho)-2-C-methyl-D-erythritol kinase [Microbacterium sp. X-17]|uniref:4-(cytidine 5'-diphospho)-2-C-methyl-D-erythritol kinase n=1 Tax=Microbacterium sp. X-17 TaxID=3144404 RepID=UPI0031F4F937